MKATQRFTRVLRCMLSGVVLAATGMVTADEPPPKKEEDRPSQKQAKAYRELFEKVGRSGLADFTKDKDTGVALHASWELHKKLVKVAGDINNGAGNRSGKSYDSDEVKKFLAFLKDRTKAPVPDWWATGITNLEVWEGAHCYRGEKPKLKKIKLGEQPWLVREGITLALQDKTVTYRSGDVSLEFPRTLLAPFWGVLVDTVTEKVTCLAGPSYSRGVSFQIAGFENKSGKRLWTEYVWAVDYYGFSSGGPTHRAEMTRAGNTVFVFGAEALGMYVEAFDIGTGKCQFRFCSNYWMNTSEEWAIK